MPSQVLSNTTVSISESVDQTLWTKILKSGGIQSGFMIDFGHNMFNILGIGAKGDTKLTNIGSIPVSQIETALTNSGWSQTKKSDNKIWIIILGVSTAIFALITLILIIKIVRRSQ